MNDDAFPDETDLQETIESLQEECVQKEHFIATLAHELRNPITALRAAVHLQEISADDPAIRAKTFDIIARQTDHMERLIDDLMDVSRLSRGKVNLDKHVIDVTSVAAQAFVDQQQSFEDHGVELRVDLGQGPVWVEADVTRLTQILGNLLNNARKATVQGDRVTIAVSQDDQANLAVLSVRDTGVGMHPDETGRIFDRFAQSIHLDKCDRGLGLGLAIVNGLVTLHGGSITAQSEGPGEGSLFVVRLPTSPGPVRQDEHDPTRQSFHEHTILIVEDDRDVAQLLVQLLQLEGHRVFVAYDAEEGLAKLKGESLDTILCDIQLPGDLDGHALCRAVRVDPRYEHVRLVAMTGHSADGDRERSLDSGFDEHLTKPVDLDELRRALRHQVT